jgi:hypothetical protein
MRRRLSTSGALVGALAGALLRVAVLPLHDLFHGGRGGVVTPLVPLSLIIGALIGAVAGAFGNPWIGLLVGGSISFLLCGAMLSPFTAFLPDAVHAGLAGLIAWFAVAAALAGLIGGEAGRRLDRKAPGARRPDVEKPRVDDEV